MSFTFEGDLCPPSRHRWHQRFLNQIILPEEFWTSHKTSEAEPNVLVLFVHGGDAGRRIRTRRVIERDASPARPSSFGLLKRVLSLLFNLGSASRSKALLEYAVLVLGGEPIRLLRRWRERKSLCPFSASRSVPAPPGPEPGCRTGPLGTAWSFDPMTSAHNTGIVRALF